MKETKLVFIADTHHFSKTLADGGRAYYLRSGSDQKCLLETGAIIDAAFAEIANSDADAVLLAGDITNDGERVCHEEMREKLYALQKKKDVFVITATHDWCCDGNPRKFVGNAVYHDVPVMGHEELRDFYFDFGPRQANSEFITHLGTCSYTVDIGENVRILALNDDQNGSGAAGFSEPHFQWIEAQIAQAQADGKVLIGMEHHLLMTHVHPMITGVGSTCVGDREAVASRLADAGLRYMFVGHSHIQCIGSFTSAKGNTITEVNVGALVGYPAPMVYVTVTDAGLKIDVETLKSFTFEGKTIDAQRYLAAHATALIDRLVEGAALTKREFTDRLCAMGLKGENFEKLYYPLHPLARLYFKATANTVYRLLCALGCKTYIDRAALAVYGDKPLQEFVGETWLSILDAQGKGVNDKAYYRLVMGVANALVHLKRCTLTLDLRDALNNILLGESFKDAVI